MITTSNAALFGGSSSSSSSQTSSSKGSVADSPASEQCGDNRCPESDELVTSSGEVKKSPDQKKADRKQTNIFAGYGAAAGVILGAGQTFVQGCLAHGWGAREWALGAVILPVFTGLGAGIGAIAAKATQKNRDGNEIHESPSKKDKKTQDTDNTDT